MNDTQVNWAEEVERARTQPAPQLEYLVVTAFSEREQMQMHLNAIGQTGWELVAVRAAKKKFFADHLIFKRPLVKQA